MIKKILLLMKLPLLLFILTGCNLDSSNKDKETEKSNKEISFDYETFTYHKNAWIRSDIKNYSYTYYSSGFSHWYAEVFVENGEFIRLNEYENSNSMEFYKDTMTDLYNSIEEIFHSERDNDDFYITSIRVEYNKDNNTIKSVDYDYYKSPKIEVDGNFSYSISNFIINK